MTKKDKITLSLRNKERLKKAADALGQSSSDLVDEILDPFLEEVEESIQEREEATRQYDQRLARALERHTTRPEGRTIQGNSSVRDAYESSRQGDDPDE